MDTVRVLYRGLDMFCCGLHHRVDSGGEEPMTLLVGPQLSAKCATDVMGWTLVDAKWQLDGEYQYWLGDVHGMAHRWHPHSSRDQAFEVALKAVEKAGEDTFVLQLDEVLNFPADDFGDTRIEFSYKGAWIFLSATPEQICNAALLAVENL
jgi:hypothetical protein